MKKTVFEFHSYRLFLQEILASPKYGRGAQRRLAEALGVQPAFVSQVLSGKLHFSPEQAIAAAEHLDLEPQEKDYFLLLLSFVRAGTESLREHWKKKMDAALEDQRLVQNRVKIKQSLDHEAQATYYSSWHYAAIHMALTIPSLQSKEDLRRVFSIRPSKLDAVLKFLVEIGVVEKKGSGYVATGKWLHLEKDSAFIPSHHRNVRLHSLENLESASPTDLHYSAFFTCTKKDLRKVQGILLDALGSFNTVVRPSKEEVLSVIGIDLYSVGRAAGSE